MKFGFKHINDAEPYVGDLEFTVRLMNANWSWTFHYLVLRIIDVLCAVEFFLAITAVIMTSSTTSAENLGAGLIDIACMSQISSHVHAFVVNRKKLVPPLTSLLNVAKIMQECCNFHARKKLCRGSYIIRGITVGTFLTIGCCLLVCLKLNRPEGQATPVATWPSPGTDMPVTNTIVSVLQLYATLSGSFIFCIVSSIHFGSLLYAATLFTALSSCIRNLHSYSFSKDARNLQLVKYVKCHRLLLGAMFDVNQICKSLLFSRINATFAVLVYTGMNISLGYVSVRVVWMTAFGFITLFQLTVAGQYLRESADRAAEAFYESRWYSEGKHYGRILCIALLRSIKPLHLSTWLCRNCDLPFFIEFVKSWYSSVQMMYKARSRSVTKNN